MSLERESESLLLTETNLKGNKKVSWCKVNCIIAIERARGGVAVLMNDEWYNAVIDFGCISSRILWVKFKF